MQDTTLANDKLIYVTKFVLFSFFV